MSFYDLPTCVQVRFRQLKDKDIFRNYDFPITVFRGVFIYIFWDFDLPVDKYRVYGSR